MNGTNIYVIPNDKRDWVVKEEGTGREFGYYPTQTDAEAVGLALARKRKSILVLHDRSGQQRRLRPARNWFGLTPPPLLVACSLERSPLHPGHRGQISFGSAWSST
jgi:hypothetical protein